MAEAANLILKQHDTYPFLRGQAKDSEGLMELSEADKLKVILKAQSGGTVIEGVAEALNPLEDSENMNWQYKWATGDTAVAGLYNLELEVTWDEGSSPPKVQTIPNGSYAVVEIKADLA